MAKIGIIVARFQSPYLHEGHMALIRYVQKHNDKTVIFLGTTSTKLTKNNPLDFEIRLSMIKEASLEVEVHSIDDHKYDNVWNNDLDSKIQSLFPNDEITLYGSRDSFIKYYKGRYKHEMFSEIPKISATRLRGSAHGYIENDEQWRKGVIYASANRYPTSYQVVDIAIVDFDRKRVLLGKKQGEQNYRFIGGFVDTSDDSLETAAKREVREECSGISTDNYKYIGSFRIDDWRYRNSEDKIMTAFFCCNYIYGNAKPNDDISQVEWFNFVDLSENNFEPEHIELYKSLKSYTKL